MILTPFGFVNIVHVTDFPAQSSDDLTWSIALS